MKEYQLSISFQEFQNTVETQVEKFGVLKKAAITNLEELQLARQQRRDLIKETIETLQDCFREPDGDLVRYFAETEIGGFNIPGTKKSIQTEIKEFRESCDTYINSLKGIVLYASLSDIMVRPDEVDIDERKKMSVEDRQVFILQKLAQVNNGAYHDVKWILESNGIVPRNYNETRELTSELEMLGFVKLLGSLSGVSASITMQGVKYIEQLEKTTPTITGDDTAGYAQMSAKMDEVVEMLVKAGVEREILFEEMEELKELYTKLSKKTWRQLVLGKLADLALGKLVETETLRFAYEHLTGEHLNLLG